MAQMRQFDRVLALLVVGLCFWTLLLPMPALSNANAPAALLQSSLATLNQQAEQRQIAVAAAAVLDGERGDFEQRGVQLAQRSPDQQAQARQALADDVNLLAQASLVAEQERQALQAYDAALMGQTRDLGALAEELRSATWPIVEQLKLYPPPLGTRGDWLAPSSDYFQTRAITISTGTLDQATQAAIEVGRASYSQRQLRELDQTYRQLLDQYAQTLQQTSASQTTQRPWWRWALATSLALGLAGLLWWVLRHVLVADWLLLVAGLAFAAWFGLPWPLAALGLLALVGLIMLRPSLAACLPLLAIPLYYRARLVGSLSFPLNETLFGISGAGLGLHFVWRWFQGQRPQLTWLKARWHWPVVALGLGLVLAAGLSLSSSGLVERATALRELRRTIVEPTIWALLVLGLLATNRVKPQSMLWSYIVMAAWIAGDGLVRFALGEGVWATTGVPRLIGLLPSSTALGVYLGAGLAGSLALALSAESIQQRQAACLLSLPLSFGVLLTFTRGAWLGLIGAVALVLLLQRRWRLLLGAGGVAVIGLIGFGLIQPRLLARVLRLGEGTGSARQEIWASAWRAVQDQPLFGFGLDQFAHLEPSRYGIPQIRFLTLAHPHNLLLDVWLQLGLLGLLVVLAMLGWQIWRWLHSRVALRYVALAMLADLVIHGMLDQTMLGGDMIYLWWSLLLISVWRPAATEES
ncbi:O-antigen ligase family protein [Herpetosiphon llansteffanensis]